MPFEGGVAVVRVIADASDLNKSLAASGRQVEASGGALAKFGAVAKASFAVAGIAAVKFAADAVNAASDQEEALNKTQVIFGDSADAVVAFANTSAESFGIAKTAALEAAAGFGNILETSGLAQDAASDMSVKLVQLAADLASFNNIDPSEALEKLRSGLAGEAEPLRTVGILLSEARVKAEAYASGIAETGAELTEGQKVQARYNLILKDSAKAQGDFARTSDGLANQQRILAATIEDLQAKLGRILLPVVKDLIETFRDGVTVITAVGDALSGLAGASDDASDSGSGLGVVWNLLSGALGPILASSKAALSALADWVDTGEEAAEVSKGYADTLKSMSFELGTAKTSSDALTDAQAQTAEEIEAATQAAQDQRDALRNLVGAASTLIGSVLALRDAQKRLKEAQGDSSTSADELRERQLAVLDAFLGVKSNLGDLIEKMRTGQATFDDVKAKFEAQATQAGLTKGQIRNLLAVLRNYIDALNNVPSEVVTNVRTNYSHQQLAEGGIVTRPTVALIGEAGPEAVIPLHKAGAWGMHQAPASGGRDGDIVVQIDGREVFRAVRDEAARSGRNNVTSGL